MDPGSEGKLHHQPQKQDPRMSALLTVWPTKPNETLQCSSRQIFSQKMSSFPTVFCFTALWQIYSLVSNWFNTTGINLPVQ